MINIKNKHFKKSIKLLLIIIAILSIGNCYIQDIDSSNSKKALITNVNKITDNSYVILTKEQANEKIKVDDSNNDKNEINNKKSNIASANTKEKKQIIDNSITIPNVCYDSHLSIGSTQEAVNQYDICIMTEAASIFGQGKPILMGGHNTKSLKFLYRSEINNVIDIRYQEIDYQYQIVYSGECTNNGQQLYDVKTGINMLDYYVDQEILYIYTCYGKNNWLVKAIKI